MLRLAHASPEIGLDLVGPCADEEKPLSADRRARLK